MLQGVAGLLFSLYFIGAEQFMVRIRGIFISWSLRVYCTIGLHQPIAYWLHIVQFFTLMHR